MPPETVGGRPYRRRERVQPTLKSTVGDRQMMDMKLEVIGLPVADVDMARAWPRRRDGISAKRGGPGRGRTAGAAPARTTPMAGGRPGRPGHRAAGPLVRDDLRGSAPAGTRVLAHRCGRPVVPVRAHHHRDPRLRPARLPAVAVVPEALAAPGPGRHRSRARRRRRGEPGIPRRALGQRRGRGVEPGSVLAGPGRRGRAGGSAARLGQFEWAEVADRRPVRDHGGLKVRTAHLDRPTSHLPKGDRQFVLYAAAGAVVRPRSWNRLHVDAQSLVVAVDPGPGDRWAAPPRGVRAPASSLAITWSRMVS